ncbi:hypothetical protein D3C71_1784910 [compost metagenome]
MLLAEALMTSRPTWVEPVNANRLTSGCAASAAPASAPIPVTTLTTPGGRPASSSSSAVRRMARDASSAGLMTAVQPVAKTGPRTCICENSGPFQGIMAPTTPTGAFTISVVTLPCSELWGFSPPMFRACAAK